MASISKIVLNINGKEIELSVEEAKDLKKMLGELFQEKAIPYIPYQPPIVIERWRPYISPYWSSQYKGNDILYVSNTTGGAVYEK